jgi:hypothetical protein
VSGREPWELETGYRWWEWFTYPWRPWVAYGDQILAFWTVFAYGMILGSIFGMFVLTAFREKWKPRRKGNLTVGFVVFAIMLAFIFYNAYMLFLDGLWWIIVVLGGVWFVFVVNPKGKLDKVKMGGRSGFVFGATLFSLMTLWLTVDLYYAGTYWWAWAQFW